MTETIGTLRAAAGEEARPANMRRIATIVGAEYVMAGKLLKLGGDRLRIEATLQKAGFAGHHGAAAHRGRSGGCRDPVDAR